jgi:phosphoribosylglycinamide formyltransferase-1
VRYWHLDGFEEAQHELFEQRRGVPWSSGMLMPLKPVDRRLQRSIGSGPVDPRIAVLASGAGSNLPALLDDGFIGPRIALVVSDKADAGALGRARQRGVRAVALVLREHGSREDYDRAIATLLEDEGIEYVLLAGFMRIFGPRVVRAFSERILNVHPSLLPAFPGARAPRDALEWGAKVTGATIHLVDEEVDHGPIVLQEAVPVLPGDTEGTLHQRIQEVEHGLYPRAARLLLEGRLKVEDRRVHILDGPE